MTIMAMGHRTNNAQLMRDCHELGYIDGFVLDMTYGKGRFWRLHEPVPMIGNDTDPSSACEHHYDFTCLPDHWDGWFDAVVFDPPYKMNGTGGSHPSDAGYGVDDAGTHRWNLILGGLEEAQRVCAPGGHILVKCQDQVVSGRKVWMTHDIPKNVDAQLIDMLHVRSYRAQPPGRRQLHSRQDFSTLLVFKKGRS